MTSAAVLAAAWATCALSFRDEVSLRASRGAAVKAGARNGTANDGTVAAIPAPRLASTRSVTDKLGSGESRTCARLLFLEEYWQIFPAGTVVRYAYCVSVRVMRGSQAPGSAAPWSQVGQSLTGQTREGSLS